MCIYEHTVCSQIIKAGGRTGVGVVPIVLHEESRRLFCILPVEKYGNYVDQYNICSGRLEGEDRGCYLRGMERELREELKKKIIEPQYLDMIGVLLRDKLTWFLHRNTPIFIFTLNKMIKSMS